MISTDYNSILTGQEVALRRLEEVVASYKPIGASTARLAFEPAIEEEQVEKLHVSTNEQSKHIVDVEKRALEYWASCSRERFYSLPSSQCRYRSVFSFNLRSLLARLVA